MNGYVSETLSQIVKIGSLNRITALSNLHQFIRLLSDERVQARVHSARLRHICKLCGNPAETFRTALAEFEYTISAICQDCQDVYTFSSDDGLNIGLIVLGLLIIVLILVFVYLSQKNKKEQKKREEQKKKKEESKKQDKSKKQSSKRTKAKK